MSPVAWLDRSPAVVSLIILFAVIAVFPIITSALLSLDLSRQRIARQRHCRRPTALEKPATSAC